MVHRNDRWFMSVDNQWTSAVSSGWKKYHRWSYALWKLTWEYERFPSAFIRFKKYSISRIKQWYFEVGKCFIKDIERHSILMKRCIDTYFVSCGVSKIEFVLFKYEEKEETEGLRDIVSLHLKSSTNRKILTKGQMTRLKDIASVLNKYQCFTSFLSRAFSSSHRTFVGFIPTNYQRVHQFYPKVSLIITQRPFS